MFSVGPGAVALCVGGNEVAPSIALVWRGWVGSFGRVLLLLLFLFCLICVILCLVKENGEPPDVDKSSFRSLAARAMFCLSLYRLVGVLEALCFIQLVGFRRGRGAELEVITYHVLPSKRARCFVVVVSFLFH